MKTQQLKPHIYFFGLSCAIGIAFSSIAPAPISGALGQLLHTTHWLIQVVGLMFTLITMQTQLNQYSWFQQRLSPWAQCLATGFLAPWIFAPIGMLSDSLLGGEPLPHHFLRDYFDEIGGMTPPVIAIWTVLQAPFLMGYEFTIKPQTPRKTSNEPLSHLDAATQLPSSAFQQLLHCSPNDIIALSSELHYVAVITQNSRKLLLYSLKNAVEELSELGLEGIQCHRSHWARHSAITRFLERGRQGEVELTNGDKLPVSRSQAKNVKAFADAYLDKNDSTIVSKIS